MGKVRILNLLAISDELNITAITKKTRLNHTRVIKHLNELKQLHLVQEKRFGRIKVFSINNTFEAGKRIKNFLKKWFLDRQDPNEETNSGFLR